MMFSVAIRARLATLAFLSAFPLTDTSALPTEPGPFIGIAEDVEGLGWDAPRREVVRVAFTRSGSSWEASAFPPSTIRWSACFDGRVLGDVATSSPKTVSPFGAYQGLQDPVGGGKVPFVGKRSFAFEGWVHREAYRPLVMSSARRCLDPDRWRPAAPPASLIAKLVPAFRQETKGIHDCDSNGKEVPLAFKDSDVSAGKSYVSESGARIVSLSVPLPSDLVNRCGPTYGPLWQPHTFAVLPDGTIQHLGFDLRLVDAGDYDGDGHSEIVFQSRNYNRDGYVLFFDSFRGRATVEWGYH
jgi:hypothetical protein